jgi:uncharacterized protein (TIGR03437 family)
MSMSTGGVLSGTPGSSTAGSYSVTVTVAGNGGTLFLGSVTLPLAINTPNFSVSPISLVFNDVYLGATPGPQSVSLGPAAVPFTITMGSTCSWLKLTATSGTAPAQIGVSVNVAGLSPIQYNCTFTVNASATYNVTVQLNVNSMGLQQTVYQTFQWYEKDPVSGINITSYFAPIGGTPPYTWSVTGFPSGATVSSNGSFSGAPSTGSAGNYEFQVKCQDSNGVTAYSQGGIQVHPGIHITTAALSNGTEQANYNSLTLAATGGSTPYSWSATGLPSGLTLSSVGVLGGTPAVGSHGAYSVQLTARDSLGGTDSATLPLTIQGLPPLTITSPQSLPTGTEAAVYGPVSFVATGGTGTYTWSATGLPSGVTMSSAGNLAGSTGNGSHGTYTVVVTVRDSAGNSNSVTLSLTVLASPSLQLTGPSSVPQATEGVIYGPITFSATGGNPPYGWGVFPLNVPPTVGATNPAALPSGLSMTSGGILSGTPAVGSAGTYSLTVAVYDSASHLYTETLTITVLAGTKPLTIAGPTSLPSGATLNSYNSVTFTATGGSGTYAWTATGLPSGLTLSASGVLSGTPWPTTAGSYTVKVTVTDSNGATASSSVPLTIVAAPVLSNPTGPPNAQVNQAYSGYTLTSSGGTPPYTYTVISGLPSGMTLSTAGVLSGTPAAGSAGTSLIQFRIADSTGLSTIANLQFVVLAATSPLSITGPASLPSGLELAGYGPITFTASGGAGGNTWSAIGLPPALTMSSGGVLSGTPIQGCHGTYNVQATVTDSSKNTASTKLTLVITAVTLSLGPASLPSGAVGATYGPVTLTASGGAAPYTWSVVSGMPNGLALGSTGVLSGTPASGSAGTYTLTVAVHDANGVSATGNWTLEILSGLYVSSPSLLSYATVGVSYGPVMFSAAGGFGSYTWSATGLPIGLSMSFAGVLSGTPAAGSQGNYAMQVAVRDSNNATASASLPLTVQAAQHITIASPASLPAWDELASYPSQQFAASGGTAPYTWSATGLPAGLTLSAGGVFNGAPASGSRGIYAVVVTVKDSTGLTGSASLSLTIDGPPQISGPASLAAATVGVSYGPLSFTATSGTAPFTWSLTGGLPSGMALSGAGVLSGAPAAGSAGSYSPTVQVADSCGLTSTAQLTLTVQANQQALAISGPASLAAATELVGYGPVTFTATGGSGGYTWSAPLIPAGLTFSAGGVLGGTPALGSSAAYYFRPTVRDSNNNSATTALVLSVNAAPALPSVTGLTPNSASAGGPAFTLTVSGAGFRSGAVVEWNGAGLSTTVLGGTQLTAAVQASLIGLAGSVPVTVMNPDGSLSGAAVFTVTAVLPATSAAGIVNAASSLPAIAPGALISIYGSNLAAANSQALATPLPTALSGTSVLIGGTAIPLLFVSAGQINAQVPYETAPGTASLVVQASGASGAPVEIQVAAVGPGVLMPEGVNHVLAVNLADGSLNQTASPALPGQYVTAYLTGQGQVSNPVATGAPAPASPFSVPVGAVQVKIGGQPADVQFAGLAPYYVGLLQLNVLIPDVAAGERPFEVSIGGVAANATVISVGAH